MEVVRDLRYRDGDSNAWRLDLALPSGSPAQLRPAIVVIHGGGWIEGDKSSFSTPKNRPPGNIYDFAKLGFVAATINYRLSKEAPYPAALHDCKCAVRWLRAHAEQYRVDPDRIGVWGNSAGGHLATLLAMTNDQPEFEGDGPWEKFSSRVQCAVSDSGPIDLVAQYEQGTLRTVVETFLNGPPDGDRRKDYLQASPSHHVHAKVPPLLLIYGVDDNQIPIETADRFVAALDQAGLKDVSYHRLAKVGHCPHSLIRVPWVSAVVDEFFVRTLKSP
jgi:acetyl esterase/lipase